MATPTPHLLLPPEATEARRRSIEKYGRLVLDAVFPVARCRACAALFPMALGINTDCGYRSVKEFIAMATKAASTASRGKGPLPRCTCGEPLHPAGARYHAFHGGLGKDIVLHYRVKPSFFGRSSTELLAWDADGGDGPLEELTPQQESEFAHDAEFRAAWGAFEIGDIHYGLRILEHLVRQFRGDPRLLKFIPMALRRGLASVCLVVAEQHQTAWPDDPEGYFWFGQVLYTALVHGVDDKNAARDAREAFVRAVLLDPNHLGAAVSEANLLRFEERFEEARTAFHQILDAHPECSDAHFNLAAMVLDDEPEEALAHFEAGEKLAPEDADYPVGCARALVALGRRKDARAALVRARRITKKHPRYAELDAAIGGRARAGGVAEA